MFLCLHSNHGFVVQQAGDFVVRMCRHPKLPHLHLIMFKKIVLTWSSDDDLAIELHLKR